MPPKAKKGEPSKKTEAKKKDKVVEDKTFGLKNKKGGKQQKFIKTVQQQVQHGNQKASRVEKTEAEKRDKQKMDKERRQAELNMLFKPVEQKVPKGVDPKSVVCAFFKQGLCGKGAKCKFSHDLNIERKGAKRSIYEDADEKDNMEDWDEAKLEEVVNKKHGEKNKQMPTTSIICKYFLDAVENSKYGWFWSCPNGETCHYRHALPPGFVLKKDQKKAEKEEQISMEELVEKERAALSSKNLTKVTLESFLKWKEKKKREKLAKLYEETDNKKKQFKEGKVLGISGREMFEFNPDLIAGDDDEADDFVYEREQDEDEVTVVELTLEALAADATSGGNVTSAPTERQQQVNGTEEPAAQAENTKMDEAGALPPDPAAETDAAIAATMAAVNGLELAGDAPIDENLFDGDDIDLVEDELEDLEDMD